MSHQLVIDLTRDAIMTALMISAPLLLIALGVGLVVAIFQSVTQIQEQTLTFVPKLVLVGAAFHRRHALAAPDPHQVHHADHPRDSRDGQLSDRLHRAAS